MTDVDMVTHTIRKLDIRAHWLFRQSYWYAERPEPGWFISVEVRRYHEFGEVPDEVIELCRRIREDHPSLFY